MKWLPIASLTLALLTLPGCGKHEGGGKRQGAKNKKAEAGEGRRVRIQDQQDQELATFILRSNLVRVEYQEDGAAKMLEARLGGSVRRYWDGKVTVAEAARTDQRILLRGADGALLWTIVLRGERVRINPNKEEGSEEGAESFWLSRADDTRLRVSRGETTLGRVTLDNAKKRVKIRDSVGNPLWDAPASKVEHWFGVLTLPDIPTTEKMLLMMEILAASDV